MIASRYLRAKRQESFISVISGFSLIGIALGVATLIIVMSVMNGFRAELLGRILGLNGHLIVQSVTGQRPADYDAAAARVRAIAGVTSATPIIEGQVMADAGGMPFGALVRGLARRRSEAANRPCLSSLSPGALDGFDDGESPSSWVRGWPSGLGLQRPDDGDAARRPRARRNLTPFGTTPRSKDLHASPAPSTGRHVGIRSDLHLHAAEGSANFFFGMGQIRWAASRSW